MVSFHATLNLPQTVSGLISPCVTDIRARIVNPMQSIDPSSLIISALERVIAKYKQSKLLIQLVTPGALQTPSHVRLTLIGIMP